jgi:hypothetical protein
MSAHEPRFESYRITRGVDTFQCPACGYPLDKGDRAVEDHHTGECYCSRHCAKSCAPGPVRGWGDVRRILREESNR